VRKTVRRQAVLLAVFLACSFFVSSALAQSPQQKQSSSPSAAPTPAVPIAAPVVASAVTSERQALALRRQWGIDDVHLRETASGSLIRFSYRVVDAEKAKVLNEKKYAPYLYDERNGLALQIPQMEKVGQLRQVSDPKEGREYWMAFSNKGRTVKPGDHVTVIIGRFRAEELVVEGSSAQPTGLPLQKAPRLGGQSAQ
jgi:hypothetical protein